MRCNLDKIPRAFGQALKEICNIPLLYLPEITKIFLITMGKMAKGGDPLYRTNIST